ncbi:cell separation during budding [Alternaria viburni]|uniref:cell separation during budding n=1 Tax=Alternaria viburni TaxID=566460 RepID=UPI0020C302C4|nr:cell separation during budding [Alternaria viburni]KAI4665080.1 cell separation during budding [Alternaria viburni]
MADHDTTEAIDVKDTSLNSSVSSIGRTPPTALKLGSSPSPASSHRSSFAEHMRGTPTSPRASRQPSLTQQALQDLLNNPPTKGGDPKFQGRDWKTVRLGEIVDPDLVRFVEYDTSVEDATSILVKHGAPNVVLLREDANTRHATGTFDYSDLNAYLLLVVGLAHPEEGDIASFDELAQKGREGKPIPLKDVKEVGGRKEPLITLDETTDLSKAIEVFGSGVHRVLVAEEGTSNVKGILTQLRLVQFFWENRSSFPGVNQLYPQLIKDLNLGSKTVLAINGDKPLAAALELMNNEGVSSLPVLDAQNNVIGNISHVDVRLLTKSTSLPLLRSSCIHFISVILSERGVNDGKDSFPVFHVNPFSTLAHTVAKLVATRSHRMWVVDAPSPASSGPSTPAITPAIVVPPSPITPLPGMAGPTPVNSTAPTHLASTGAVAPAISASAISAMPGASLSGRLSGVISLTDILNLFARASGLNPHDPDEARPPKFDPSEVKVIHLRATGGEVGASSALAPKIGPLGLSPKKVGEDIAKATGDWKGLRVTVKLTIQNRQAAVSVVPSASSLVIKALKEPPRDRKKEKNIKHTKSVPLDEIISIARTMRFKSMAKSLQGTVLEILGTAFSTGCKVDGRSPKDVSDDIKAGEIEIPEE